ncbi:outer membrane protein, cobalt-zinc-cadmium efflux system [Duganella sp. CF458]|uniref:TolC family protein n=1 Tax=Duganella sp. CF458 TaxID=1884368 RepID=UPI0008EA64B6|nr:TolC family protein [Duganella sp. CF458]SFF96475.1 outer membrane protein, cobalt-zinc-cadmium efflux system [Duganella sp. CF458]
MKAICVPLLAAICMAPAWAQPSLTLAEALERARRSNPELQALALEASAVDAAGRQASLLPNPSLDYLREGKTSEGGSSTVQLSIPLELGGKRAARMEAARTGSRAAALDLAVGRARIEAEVVAAYQQAYLAQQHVALAAQVSETGRRSSDAAARRVLAGKVSPVEEARARVAEANWRMEGVTAQRELDEARIKLASLLGDTGRELVNLAAPASPAEAGLHGAQLEGLIASAPAIERAVAEVDAGAASLRMERAARVPDVSLIVGSKRSEGPERDRVRQNIIGLSVPLPLFNRNQGAILAAERRTDKARAELEATRQRIRAEAMQAHARMQAATQQERLVREDVLPGAQYAAEAAMKGFEAGKFNYVEVLDAQRTWVQAQGQHLRAISDFYRARADLAKLVGNLDTKDSK